MIRARSPIHPPRRRPQRPGESGSHASCMRRGHYITTYNNDTLVLKPCAMHRFGAVGNSNATLNSGRNCSVVEFKVELSVGIQYTPDLCIVEAQIWHVRSTSMYSTNTGYYAVCVCHCMPVAAPVPLLPCLVTSTPRATSSSNPRQKLQRYCCAPPFATTRPA